MEKDYHFNACLLYFELFNKLRKYKSLLQKNLGNMDRKYS
jgi:hypothetical protein